MICVPFLTITLQANVTKSCTIRVNEEVYCIRDDEQWKDCPNGADVDTLVAKIDDLYQNS